jgi:hypothetical protein
MILMVRVRVQNSITLRSTKVFLILHFQAKVFVSLKLSVTKGLDNLVELSNWMRNQNLILKFIKKMVVKNMSSKSDL